MELRQKVLTYYLENFSRLSPADQFHFATRTAAWLGLPETQKELTKLRSYIVPALDSHESYVKMFREMVGTPAHTKINAAMLRAPYFEKYTPLYGIELAIFRLHWLQNVYQIDARQAFLEAIDIPRLRTIERGLLADPEAVRALSTYAINFIYLFHIDILQDTQIPRAFFYDLGKEYDTTDPEQLQLLIYLYTHCILCETHFYTKAIAPEYMGMYLDMLRVVEDEIDTHFDDIHLDNKVEFLVCCQICDYPTRLADRITAECEQSISKDGTFIVDTLNNTPQTHRRSFETSEHRNVLYIMSGSPYAPHSIAVV